MQLFTLPDGDADIFNFRSPKAVQPFPHRKAILYAILCLVWVLFGIFGRDPWKPEETVLTAIVADMAINSLTHPPTLIGEAYTAHPPLYLWLAALTAKAAAFVLPHHEGARLANVLLLLGGFLVLWHVVRRAYGQRVAWLAVLSAVGAIGFMVRAHLLSFGVPAFFGASVVLAGASVLQDNTRYYVEAIKGAIIVILGCLFLLFSVSWLAACTAVFAVCLWSMPNPQRRLIAGIIMILFPLAAWWTLTGSGYTPAAALADKWRGASVSTGLGFITDWVRIMAWSLLPLLPLAALGVWLERRALSSLAVFALLSCVLFALLFLAAGGREEDLYVLLPPLALLAARALQRVSDDMARVLDSFALLVIGVLCCGGVWFVWLVLHIDKPAFAMRWLMENLPGFSVQAIIWWKVIFAAILTIGWVTFISNFGRSNERAAVNWCFGITLLWAVFNLLLVEYVDSGKSYRPPAMAIAAKIGNACLTSPTDGNWRAQLHYFGVKLGDNDCPYKLEEQASGEIIWQGGRGGRTVYYLTRRF